MPHLAEEGGMEEHQRRHLKLTQVFDRVVSRYVRTACSRRRQHRDSNKRLHCIFYIYVQRVFYPIRNAHRGQTSRIRIRSLAASIAETKIPVKMRQTNSCDKRRGSGVGPMEDGKRCDATQ